MDANVRCKIGFYFIHSILERVIIKKLKLDSKASQNVSTIPIFVHIQSIRFSKSEWQKTSKKNMQ